MKINTPFSEIRLRNTWCGGASGMHSHAERGNELLWWFSGIIIPNPTALGFYGNYGTHGIQTFAASEFHNSQNRCLIDSVWLFLKIALLRMKTSEVLSRGAEKKHTPRLRRNETSEVWLVIPWNHSKSEWPAWQPDWNKPNYQGWSLYEEKLTRFSRNNDTHSISRLPVRIAVERLEFKENDW